MPYTSYQDTIVMNVFQFIKYFHTVFSLIFVCLLTWNKTTDIWQLYTCNTSKLCLTKLQTHANTYVVIKTDFLLKMVRQWAVLRRHSFSFIINFNQPHRSLYTIFLIAQYSSISTEFQYILSLKIDIIFFFINIRSLNYRLGPVISKSFNA